MKTLTLRSLLLVTVLLVAVIRCGPPSSMLSTGSALLDSLGKSPTLSTISGLMKTPGLGQFLDSTLGDKFTFLAPTNDALASLGTDVLSQLTNPANVGDLANVLKKHIVPDKVSSADLLKGGHKTAGGNSLDLTGVKLGTPIEDKKFTIIPVDKVLK